MICCVERMFSVVLLCMRVFYCVVCVFPCALHACVLLRCVRVSCESACGFSGALHVGLLFRGAGVFRGVVCLPSVASRVRVHACDLRCCVDACVGAMHALSF